MRYPGKTCVLCVLLVPQQCLGIKVDFEHLFKGRFPTLFPHIALLIEKL